MTTRNVAAVDLGAESGRVMVARFDGRHLDLEEAHRFPNRPVTLLGQPFHYRDSRTDGVMEQVFARLPREVLYRCTGIQFLPINTLFQLYAHERACRRFWKTSITQMERIQIRASTGTNTCTYA